MPITKEDAHKIIMETISGVKEQGIMKGLLEDIFEQFAPPKFTDSSVEVKSVGNFTVTNFNNQNNE